ncbi:TPA: XRE family transcriptional regulator [Staphylococcus aureus]|nr:XRE family transcriptional regulator [Staphylococcus aureus]
MKTIDKLLNSDLSAFNISKETGVDASSIQRIRSGKRSLSRLSLEAGEKLFNFQLQHEDSNTSNYD